MRVYFGRNLRSLLTKLAKYSDTRIKNADRIVCSLGKSPQDETPRLLSRVHELSSYVMIGDAINGNIRTASTVSPGSYDSSHCTTLTRTSKTISYCQVCLEKSHTLVQCSYVKDCRKILQKQEESCIEQEGTVKSSQSCCRCGRGTFHSE